MIIRVAFLLFITLLNSCTVQDNKSKMPLTGILLNYELPNFDMRQGNLITVKDSIKIYYLDDLILFKVDYLTTTYNKKAIVGNEVIASEDPKTIESQTPNSIYYLCKKGAETGLKYDSLSAKTHTEFNVNNLLEKRTFKGAKLYDTTNDILAEPAQTSKDGRIFEKYVPKTKFDASYNDSTYLFFTKKFKDVPYSLSKEADSLKKMKLTEVNFIYNAVKKDSKNKMDIPRRKFIFKITEINIDNKSEILTMFKRFKEDSSYK